MSVFEPEHLGSLCGIYVLKGILHMTMIIDLSLKKRHCVSEQRGNGGQKWTSQNALITARK